MFNESNRSHIGAIGNFERTMTKQEFREECDINTIMSKYLAVGVFPPNVKVASYGDFSEATDFQESLHIIQRGRDQFAGLPSKVRERFKNDPVEFLKFVHNKDNLKEAASLGLLTEEAARVALTPPAKPEDKK